MVSMYNDEIETLVDKFGEAIVNAVAQDGLIDQLFELQPLPDAVFTYHQMIGNFRVKIIVSSPNAVT